MKKNVDYTGDVDFYKVPLRFPQDDDLKQYADDQGKVTLAWVYALNHPRLGRRTIRTSVVIKQHQNGDFETLNTIYKKVLDKE